MAIFERIDKAAAYGWSLYRTRRRLALIVLSVTATCLGLVWAYFSLLPETVLRHVSYDSTRKLYHTLDMVFQEAAGDSEKEFRVYTSHAASVRQAYAVTRGMVADVVTLATPLELDAIAEHTGCIRRDWRSVYPYGSSPFTSTIVFLVRKGNPRQVRDWDDLWRTDVRLVLPSPLVSGAGRYAYLALVASSDSGAADYGDRVRSLCLRSRFLDYSARQSLEIFLRETAGDVFLTWESDALEYLKRTDADFRLELIYPSLSILAEPVVALVDCNVDQRGTRELATNYLDFLFGPQGQRIIAEAGLRPRMQEVLRSTTSFKELPLFSVEDAFGSWSAAWDAHLSPDGSFERAMRYKRARSGGSE